MAELSLSPGHRSRASASAVLHRKEHGSQQLSAHNLPKLHSDLMPKPTHLMLYPKHVLSIVRGSTWCLQVMLVSEGRSPVPGAREDAARARE